MFRLRNKKIFFWYALLTKSLLVHMGGSRERKRGEGGGGLDPPPGKSEVAIGFLQNSVMDPISFCLIY